jgi:hypothetical protein
MGRSDVPVTMTCISTFSCIHQAHWNYRKAMSHVRKNLQVERLLSLGQYLHSLSTLLGHEQLVGVWHGKENGCFWLSVI